MPQPQSVDSTTLKAFGAELRRERDQHDLTQEQLANRLGVSGQAVGTWERGEAQPQRHHVFLAEEALGLSAGRLSRILGFEPPGSPPDVEAAIRGDAALDRAGKDALITMYRHYATRTPKGRK